jgi:sugar phosphate isomerase/epimerase
MKALSLAALALLSFEVAVQAEPLHFGCQARTFGEGIYKDEAAFLNVVRQIGEVGFEGIETNWKNLERYFDRPADFAKILKDARLKLVGAHMGGAPWNAAAVPKLLGDVERTAQFVKTVGGDSIVFSGAFPKARPLPTDTWQKMAEFMNEVGRVCAKNGVRCLYHNHWVECEGDGLEQLCKRTDPNLVGFAFDTGHAVRAGKDPAAVIGVLGKRLGVIHFADASEEVSSVTKRPPLGEGRLKIPAVVAALRKAGFNKWIVLEEETAAAGRSLAEKGLAIFRKVFQQPR